MEKQILEIQIQAMAVVVRVEGMKADNQQREHRQESLAYVESDFERAACELESLWQELTRIG